MAERRGDSDESLIFETQAAESVSRSAGLGTGGASKLWAGITRRLTGFTEPGAQIREDITFRTLGWRMFRALVAVSLVALAGVFVFAWRTYPTSEDLRDVLTSVDATARPQLLRELRSDWVESVARIAQIFVFGSLVPLLGTVIGYVLGQQREEQQ